jgi:hypothetical protein
MTRLSRGHLIWLLPHPVSLPCVSSTNDPTGKLGKRDNLPGGKGGGKERGREPNHGRTRKPSINHSILSGSPSSHVVNSGKLYIRHQISRKVGNSLSNISSFQWYSRKVRIL